MELRDEILIEAFKMYNDAFIDEIQKNVEPHVFSGKFTRKMRRLIISQKKFGGRMWLARTTELVTKAAVIVLCLITINTISVKAFKFDIWKTIVTETEKYFNINFEKEKENISDRYTSKERLKIKEDSRFTEIEFYSDDFSTMQLLEGDAVTISYIEGSITETADINLSRGEMTIRKIDGREVTFVIDEGYAMALFTDDTYYHLITMQGVDATKDNLIEIINNLEER